MKVFLAVGVCAGLSLLLWGLGTLFYGVWMAYHYGWLDDRVFDAQAKGLFLSMAGYGIGMASLGNEEE